MCPQNFNPFLCVSSLIIPFIPLSFYRFPILISFVCPHQTAPSTLELSFNACCLHSFFGISPLIIGVRNCVNCEGQFKRQIMYNIGHSMKWSPMLVAVLIFLLLCLAYKEMQNDGRREHSVRWSRSSAMNYQCFCRPHCPSVTLL